MNYVEKQEFWLLKRDRALEAALRGIACKMVCNRRNDFDDHRRSSEMDVNTGLAYVTASDLEQFFN